MQNHRFVWPENHKTSRISHVFFRRVLSIPSNVSKAEINLSARTQYHLRINGVFIGCGPARSYPEFLEYDSYDILKFIRPGRNTIAADVVHYGNPNYHFPYSDPGFIAWGEIETTPGLKIDLSTSHDWKCLESEAYDKSPPSFSFAIGPIQIKDERRSPKGWDGPDFDDSSWKKPAKVSSPAKLLPRQIPALTADEVIPEKFLSSFTHADDEEILSFRIVQDFDRVNARFPDAMSFAYAYVHSPRKQKISAGAWWGEHFLNGTALKRSKGSDGTALKENITLDLNKGWNTFFVSYGMTYGIWEFHLAIPRRAGVSFTADKRSQSAHSFNVAGPFPMDFSGRILEEKPWIDPENISQLKREWKKIPSPSHPVSPMRNIAWTRKGKILKGFSGKPVPVEIAPGKGRSVVYDFGNIVLGRIFVEYTAPAGTVIDVAYAEELENGRPRIGKNFLVNAAERQITGKGKSRMETYSPRGFRYLEVSVHGHSSSVKIHRTGIVSQRYPCRKVGYFKCSDPFFNTLWEYGWRTIQLCSEDVITDCPWRERTLYGGDLLPEMATTFVTSGDMRLVKRCIEIFLQSQNPKTGLIQSMAPMFRGRIPLYEYQFIVFLCLEWYCRMTGDAKFARRAYPVYRKLIDNTLRTRNPDGLFPAVHPLFIEHGYKANRGISCAFNSLMVEVMKAWSRFLLFLSKESESGKALSVSREIAVCVNSEFWSSRNGFYMDSVVNGMPDGCNGAAANAWAMMFAGVPDDRIPSISAHFRPMMDKFDPLKETESVSSYGAFYLLGALYSHGFEADAEKYIKIIYKDMIEKPTGTIWEHSHKLYSLTHAWSTAPNYYLSTSTLGVRMGFPDCLYPDKIVIAPQSETLAWAEGIVPHPLGEVFVRWKIEEDSLVLEYRCPEGSEVYIRPRGRLARMKLLAKRTGSG